MDVRVKSSKKVTGIQKHIFSSKSMRKNGLLIQVHHTLAGNANPIRFLHATFQEATDTLAVADAKGNIFIIDLTYNRFWALPNVVECSGLAFSPYNKYEILVSSTGCNIKIINFENGKESGSLQGHKLPPTQLTFGGEEGKWLLSAAPCPCKRNPGEINSTPKVEYTGEALVWDLSSCAQAHRLNVRPDSGIKKAMFMDGISSGQILVCFEDDAMFVWQFGKFECMKQILPVTWNEGQHHVKAIAFTRNGRAMVVGGKSHSLVVFSLDTWAIEKVIELPDGICGIKHLQFLPQPFDGGSNRVLAILSSNSQVFFLDLHSSTFIGIINLENNKICKLVCSPSGRYVACVLQSGEVNIYCSTKLLESGLVKEEQVNTKMATSEQDNKIDRTVDKTSLDVNNVARSELRNERIAASFGRKSKHMTKKHFSKVTEEIRSELDPKRLLPILRQVGEFPSRYRALAWRTALLQLPCNRKAYASLVRRGIHPSYAHLDQKYPLENQSELKSLKRVLSCLAHWSPLFSQVNYLPLFTYPFVKLFVHDPFSCFEVIATIIINYCQHWYEFFPFPPINALASIENLLAHHDSDLLQFFVNNGIDTRVYAWPMLQVAFSEVLSNEEWLRLWDHILVNEPSFLLAAVPAYCIVCRSALLSCKNIEDFQFFFQNQNPVNMDRFISKIYHINKATPFKFHPRKYLQEFKPITEGDSYPVFNQYPKILVDGHAEKLKILQEKEEDMIRKELAALKILREQEEQKILAENAYLQQKHFAELEKAYQMAVQVEEEKIADRHKELMNLRKELAETEDVAKKVTNSSEEEAKTNLRLCMVRQLLRDLEQKTCDLDRGCTGLHQADAKTLSGRLSHISDLIHQLEDDLKGRQPYFISKRDEQALSQDNSIQNLKQEIKKLKMQIQEYGKGKERQHKDQAGSEIFSVVSENEEMASEEYKGWFGGIKNCSESICEQKKHRRNKPKNNYIGFDGKRQKEASKVMCQAQLPRKESKNPETKDLTSKLIRKCLRESKASKISEDDEIVFVRGLEEQRWKLNPSSTRETRLWKHLDHNVFSTVRNDEFYNKEQEAIRQAMESRAHVLSARNWQIPNSTSAVT